MIPRRVQTPLGIIACPLHAMPSNLEGTRRFLGGSRPPKNHCVPSTRDAL